MSHKTISVGIAVVMALAVGFVLYSERSFDPVQDEPPVDAAWEAELQARSAELNEQLPTLVDPDTLLVTTAARGNTLEFRHTLVNLQKEEVDVAGTSSDLYASLRAAACSSDELKVYRDHDTTLQYAYYDKDGDYILGVKVQTSACR